ncbi:glutamate/tyrosine decarboxylase-like PLP-dependent enzyme [Arthrobacter stackebrandtii]|uniref:Glutamate/tyrosine decarboxylase-like PLP-dependent enzyme n=1 Tax=Arthrobacter stackebrandtii TaxID=272161 RepID=A0ABS4YWC6_9MICC|nr:aminotransferase class V-fold PLP-dependent enzyme [Arthrobacter stackebrandtii]MBP2413086.1 glutamate/tyrosine decarboxylase-like PLP-dependent enzyme [Arthrobacter stackebrandtii]PYH01144.1 aspartate aminotransferase family protein [Arthrobacter stackebrandtii]
MIPFAAEPEDILRELAALRSADAPTHGGGVLSYVYDSGVAAVDELAAAAMAAVQPLNGLDPTTFTSIAAMERDVTGFMRTLLGGGDDVVGSVTSGGTESCMLAVKTARENFHRAGKTGTPRLLAPASVHAAFHKAAHYFGLTLDLVPVDGAGRADAAGLAAAMGPDVALVVVSAPSYPHAVLDPVAEVARAAQEHGIDCHVDACIGGLVLPFWEGLPEWDLRVSGVTSISADLHKYGYAPKGASVLLTRGRDRQRAQYFATTSWPGYPVVNPTLLGSKSAAPLAAAWAIIKLLGTSGFAELAASCRRSTEAVLGTVAGIEGLRVVGTPTGPLLAVAVDGSVPAGRRVDPHHWADNLKLHGFTAQLQPAFTQADGSVLPRTTHLTITPVTESRLPELTGAMVRAAEAVRGVPGLEPQQLLAANAPLAALLAGSGPRERDSAAARTVLAGLGLAGSGLPAAMAPVLALVEALPADIAAWLLTELLATVAVPPPAFGG